MRHLGMVAILASVLLLGSATAFHPGVTEGVGFSVPLANLLKPEGYETCIIGNFGGPAQHALVHHWKFLSRTGGPTTLRITAISVSASDAGSKVVAAVEHEPGGTSTTVEVTHSGVQGPSGNRSVDVTVLTLAGRLYDLTIENVQGLGEPTGHHYSIGVVGPDADRVELAYGDPSLEYLEPAFNRWAINAAPGEQVSLLISIDSGPGVPTATATATYLVLDPAGGPAPIARTSVTFAPGASFPIGFTNNADTPKTYVVAVVQGLPGSHFKLDKQSGDQGIYALNCVGPRQIAIDIKPGSFPNAINLGKEGTIPVAIISTPDFNAASVDPTTVSLEGAQVRLKGKGTPMASSEDVNEDGLMDLVVHVVADSLDLAVGDSEAQLTGFTYRGVGVRGTDSVKVME